MLKLNDVFWTLQGEGHFSGRRALFVRLPFCNYDCPWCDTEYNSYKDWTEEVFVEFAKQEPARFAVITGGEPLVNKQLHRIVGLLKDLDFYIACETNGSAPAHEDIDFVTTSPKQYTKGHFNPFFIHPEIVPRTSEWKYVVDSNFDFSVLDRHQPLSDQIYYSLSPEFQNMQENTRKIITYIKEHPRWQLSLQSHKWIDIP
ncbi:MAG: 7-carboxy-7-deazaguanine synthase QueE [Pseudomonadota bacterium]